LAQTSDIKLFVEYFKNDWVVIFPTDTVVGLGCRFDSVDGIARIRQIKRITAKNPMAVLISEYEQLDMLQVRRSKLSNFLMQRFWPGGLTIVLSSDLEYPCSGQGNTLGVRMPDVDFLRRIVSALGVPIVATSANIHNHPTPARIEEVETSFRKKVDRVIKFDVKPNGLPSTVVRIEGGILKVQREGAITQQEIFQSMGTEFERR